MTWSSENRPTTHCRQRSPELGTPVGILEQLLDQRGQRPTVAAGTSEPESRGR